MGEISRITYSDDNNADIHWMFKFEWGVNCKYFLEIPTLKEDSFIRNEVSDLLTSLRLYKQGKIEVPFIFSEKLGNFQNVKPRHVKNERLYRLELSDIPDIELLYEKIKGMNDKKYRLIIERFNNAISDSSSLKNAYIDLVGIIESVLLQNKKDELRYRFSLLLSNTLKELGTLISFKEAQSIYDIRSSLAHSGDAKDFDDASFFNLLNYTRKIIKWYIENDLDDSKAQTILFNKLDMKYK
jgi:hypothetical protein